MSGLDVEALYREHASNLRGFIVNRLGTDGDDERIDDLCSDVWARVWARRHQYHDRGVNPKAWLFRIAQNELVDEYRRLGAKHRPLWVPLDMVDAWKATVDAGSDCHVERIDAEMLLAIDCLMTDEQRRVIECRFFLGMDEHQMATALGRTPGAVKKLQMRALINLRKYLGVAA